MARADNSQKDFAKKLVQLSLEDGMVSSDKVQAVLGALAEKPPRNFKSLLKQYMKLIKVEIRKSQAIVELAGEIGEETLRNLESRLAARYGRAISISTRENPDLIAGLRVSVADDVYDASLTGQLESLAGSVK